jgi:D-alanine-D-alanine ligase-like ATP-grasp enzyme
MEETTNIFQRIQEIGEYFLPSRPLVYIPISISRRIEKLFFQTLMFLKLLSVEKDFSLSDIPLRTSVFIQEGKRHSFSFLALKGPKGFVNYFLLQTNRKSFLFQGLPGAEFLSKSPCSIDDKYKVKQVLKRNNLPVLEGRSFWFFQRKKALKFATQQLGFPLVVKPRSGSVSSCVTTNIENLEQLQPAIDRVISRYSCFIIERFLPNSSVFRATVIDFEKVFCVQQIPANVIGDGVHNISQLIEIKNKDPRRGNIKDKNVILYKLVVSKETEKLLSKKEYNLSSIPAKNEKVFLQKDPFLKLGGDLLEITSKVHPENVKLFCRIAKLFDTRLVGIDFLASDISISWKNQSCAILELNSLPCIEMHHFPSQGKPQDVAKALIQMFSKYYL